MDRIIGKSGDALIRRIGGLEMCDIDDHLPENLIRRIGGLEKQVNRWLGFGILIRRIGGLENPDSPQFRG